MSRERNNRFCIGSAVFMLVLLSAIASFAETINYDYDNMGQLTSVGYGDGTVVSYVYDNAGNRLQKATTLSGAPGTDPNSRMSKPYTFVSSTVLIFERSSSIW